MWFLWARKLACLAELACVPALLRVPWLTSNGVGFSFVVLSFDSLLGIKHQFVCTSLCMLCCADYNLPWWSGQCLAGLFGSGCPEGCAAKAQSSPSQREWQSEETEIRQLQVLEDWWSGWQSSLTVFDLCCLPIVSCFWSQFIWVYRHMTCSFTLQGCVDIVVTPFTYILCLFAVYWSQAVCNLRFGSRYLWVFKTSLYILCRAFCRITYCSRISRSNRSLDCPWKRPRMPAVCGSRLAS